MSKCYMCDNEATHLAFIDGCAEQKVCAECGDKLDSMPYGMNGVIASLSEIEEKEDE